MIDVIVEEYDREPSSWRDNLVQYIQPEHLQVCFAVVFIASVDTFYYYMV